MTSGKELFVNNECARWLVPAVFIRYIGFFCNLFYVPIFFSRTYPDMISEYSTINGIIYIIIANISALTGGILSDKLEKDSYWAQPGIIMTTTLISGPLLIAGLLNQEDFTFSITCLALHYLFS